MSAQCYSISLFCTRIATALSTSTSTSTPRALRSNMPAFTHVHTSLTGQSHKTSSTAAALRNVGCRNTQGRTKASIQHSSTSPSSRSASTPPQPQLQPQPSPPPSPYSAAQQQPRSSYQTNGSRARNLPPSRICWEEYPGATPIQPNGIRRSSSSFAATATATNIQQQQQQQQQQQNGKNRQDARKARALMRAEKAAANNNSTKKEQQQQWSSASSTPPPNRQQPTKQTTPIKPPTSLNKTPAATTTTDNSSTAQQQRRNARAQSSQPATPPKKTPTSPPKQALSAEEDAKIALQDTHVVRDVDAARRAVELLKRHARENEEHAHAIDTEVQSIDVKADGPCGHGRVICISVYAGPLVDFANNKIYSRLSDVPSDARRTLWIDTGVVLTEEQQQQQQTTAEMEPPVNPWLEEAKANEKKKKPKSKKDGDVVSAETSSAETAASEASDAVSQPTMTVFGKYPSTLEDPDLYKASDIMEVFQEYLEDDVSQKVWHNYGFDRHVLENVMLENGKTVKLAGFHGDTMHMARLFDTSRRAGAAAAATGEDGEDSAGGTSYSLESLSTDRNIFSHYDAENDLEVVGRTGNEGAEDREKARELLSAAFAKRRSMKEIFSKKKVKKDGTEGKTSVMPEMEELQTSEETKDLWVAYSGTDAKATWMLYRALRCNLRSVCARVDKALYPSEEGRDDSSRRTLWNVYRDFLRPFGELLTDLESVGVWVDRDALKKGEETAQQAEKDCIQTFVDWASTYIENAKYINPGSVIQLRQLFYAGLVDPKTGKEIVAESRTFKTENTENIILPDAKTSKPKKYLDFDLTALLPGKQMTVYGTTPSGLPQVNGPMLRKLAGNPGAGKAYLDALDAGESSPPTNGLGDAFSAFGGGREGARACHAIDKMCEATAIQTQVGTFLQPLQKPTHDERIHCSLNLNTETGRLSSRRPNMQNLPALEKDLFGVRKAIRAEHGNALVVADYGQLELRLLAHLAQCQSMLHAFEVGGDFHSRTALGMYDHIKEAVSKHEVLLDYSELDDSIPDGERPPLIKDVYASERRKAKVLNFSIAYGKTEYGLSKDFGVSVEEAKDTVNRWYADRPEVLAWQEEQRRMAMQDGYVATMLGRRRNLPNAAGRAGGGSGGRRMYNKLQGGALRAAINSPIQGSAADVAMCAMIRIHGSEELRRLGWKLLLQVHDEVILEGPESSSQEVLELTRQLMESPFDGLVEADHPALSVALSVDAKTDLTWYDAK